MTHQHKRSALVAWLGGFLAGPLPAAVVMILERHDRDTWHYRRVTEATVFWTILVLAWASVVVVDIGFRSGPNGVFFAGWGLTVALALSATAYSVVRIVRRADG